jgi:hypothetical protein
MDCRLQVYKLLPGGRDGLVGYQGLRNLLALPARRSTSTALLNSVPRLNHGLL